MAKIVRNIFGRKHVYTTFRTKVLLYIAWKNLTNKMLRSLLTIFGVVIGIGAIFFLLSFGLGLQQLVTTQVIGDQSIKSIDVSSPNSKLIKLDDEAINKMRTYSHVDKVGAQHSYAGSINRNSSEVDSAIYGVDLDFQELSSIFPIEGRLLEKTDYQLAVVNISLLDTIGIKDYKASIGQVVDVVIPLQGVSSSQQEIRNTFTIVGVIDSGSGNEMFIPSAVFGNAGINIYKNAKIKVDNSSNVAAIRQQLNSLGFETTSPVDTLDQINRIFRFFTFILIGFGSIGMIVSILGMFNTLTISLLERTKEIGLMIALGSRNSDMKKLFIFEAVIISLIGALLGIALAISGGFIVNIIMNRYARSRGVGENFVIFSFPLWAILSLTLFTVMIGLVVVYFPAKRAQKIDPIDALRRE